MVENQGKRSDWVVVWVVVDYKNGDIRSEMDGVFSSEKLALEHIGSSKVKGLGPLEIDNPLPEETCDWVGFYYPN